MSFRKRDFTGILDFSVDEIEYVLNKSAMMKQALVAKDVKTYRLALGKDLMAALLFYENSTRTRSSFDVAAKRLGMNVTGFAGSEGTSVKKGESLRHTLDMFEAYMCDCVIMRHPLDGSARFAAEHLGIPVFNAGDGKHEHPTQTLLDLFTIREHLGRLTDFDMGISGDLKYGRTAHSLVMALSLFSGIRLHLFSHDALALPSQFMDMARDSGMELIIHESMRDIASSVDILYQTRIQKERMPDLSEYEKAKRISAFRQEHMDCTNDAFGLMHPMPIDKDAPGISSVIDGHPKALYKIQAGNGVPTRLTEMALALGLMGADFIGTTLDESSVLVDYIEELPVRNKTVRQDVSIRPIRNNGVVIDHLVPYTEDMLMQVLKVRQRNDIYRAATVKSLRSPGTVKGMLMIENRLLDMSEIKTVASIAPGSTVNLIENGSVVRKIKLHLPYTIDDVPGMTCGNMECICRPRYLESVPPRMVRAGKSVVKCNYCGHLMNACDVV